MKQPKPFSLLENPARRRFLHLAAVGAAGLSAGCAVNPVSQHLELMLVSPDSEIEIDRRWSPHQFSADYGPVQDPALNDYITRVGTALLPHVHRPDMPYSFRVVNACHVNAYAFPGGSIAATRAILCTLDNEAQLAALLGHELGHVNARHTASQITRSQITGLVVSGLTLAAGTRSEAFGRLAGQLGSFGAGVLLASYSRDMERQADALGNRYMVAAGYSSQGFVGLMEMLNSLSQHPTGAVELLFATHPMSAERYRIARENAAERYRASHDAPLHRERFMDATATVRAAKAAVTAIQNAGTALAENHPDQARELLTQALRHAPDDYCALVMLARCQLMLEKPAEAARIARDACQAYPGEAQGWAVSGLAHLQTGACDKALEAFTRCARVLPGNPAMDFLRGYACECMHDRARAAEHYRTFLQSVREGPQAEHAWQRLVEWGYIRG